MAKVFKEFEVRFNPLTIANKLNIVTALTTEGDKPAMTAKLHNRQRIMSQSNKFSMSKIQQRLSGQIGELTTEFLCEVLKWQEYEWPPLLHKLRTHQLEMSWRCPKSRGIR